MLKPCQGPPHVVSSLPACPPAAPPRCVPGSPQRPPGAGTLCGWPWGLGTRCLCPPAASSLCCGHHGHGAGLAASLRATQSNPCREPWPHPASPAAGTEPRVWHRGKSCLGPITRSHTQYGAASTGHCHFSTSLFTGLQTGASELKSCDFGRDIYTAALSGCW